MSETLQEAINDQPSNININTINQNNEINTLVNQTNYKNTPHIILISVIFLSQFYSKRVEATSELNLNNKKKADRLFWKYIIIFQLAKASDWCLGPFIHEFFNDYHGFNVEISAKMIAIAFASSLFSGSSIIGYLNNGKNKKIPMILYCIVLSFSCLLRFVKGNIFYVVISQMLYGVASCILYSSFENWFVYESNNIKDKDVRDYVLSSAFEKSMVADAMIAVGVSYISGILKKSFGIHIPFMLSAGICLITLIIIIFFINSGDKREYDNASEEDSKINASKTKTKKQIASNTEDINTEDIINIEDEEKTQDKYEVQDLIYNVLKAIKTMIKNPFILLIGITESLYFAMLHIFIFSWAPTLKKINPNVDVTYVFTLLMMSLMTGGSTFRALYNLFKNNAYKVAKVMSVFALVGLVLISIESDYQTTLIGLIIYETSVGLFYPTFSKIKADYLPRNQSGTISNLFKIPFNIIVIVLLVNTNKLFSVEGFLKLNMFISLFLAFIVLMFFNKKNNLHEIDILSEISKSNDNKLKKH